MDGTKEVADAHEEAAPTDTPSPAAHANPTTIKLTCTIVL
jgi:hypothetical protein